MLLRDSASYRHAHLSLRYPTFLQPNIAITLNTYSHLYHCTMSTSYPSGPSPPLSINEIPKTWNLPSKLPPDSKYPTPSSSDSTPRHHIIPRQVQHALFTYVRPEPTDSPKLLAVSPAALKTLNIDLTTVSTPDFLATVSGNKLQGWDPANPDSSLGYPWAQCYGGFQFGMWAGQLGDGRAISLFETTPPGGPRYELQLKGAGLTPYSRFADGRAVLRSSIREFIASEALHALKIPSTRALSLTKLPGVEAFRETMEPCAIVLRFAESWIRLGTFDLPRIRQDFETLRILAEYVATDVYGGWENLPGRLKNPEAPSADPLEEPRTGIPKETVEGPPETSENRFARLYRAIVQRNARGVAAWQAYGFLNGVLNTDNTSVLGLSMDYGPFAFLDVFDPQYTPNHDDSTGRYAYCKQPTIVWWNLVRLGEAMAHLMGAAERVDDVDMKTRDDFVKHEDFIIPRAEALIGQAGEEYKAVFTAEYHRRILLRLGLRTPAEDDVPDFIPAVLDGLADCKLDFHRFFRRLSEVKVADVTGEVSTDTVRSLFEVPVLASDESVTKLANWLVRWRERVSADWERQGGDEAREAAMKKVNPKFVPRGWVLSQIIEKVQKGGDEDVLRRVMHMTLNPFDETWSGREFDGVVYEGNKDEEERWTGPVPVAEVGMQCSCSS